MGTFWGTLLIYSGWRLLTVTLLMFLYPKTVLGLGTGGVPVSLVYCLQKTL